MELKTQFEIFLIDIRPTPRQKEDWKVGHNTLDGRIWSDANLKEIVVATFLQGSIRRSTAIRPSGDKRPDVDLVVVTRLNKDEINPTDAMAKFHPLLNSFYKGKWQQQDRSLGIELSYVDLDLVITSLPVQNDRVALEEIYKSQAVRTNDTLEELQNWNLNKNWNPEIINEGNNLLDTPEDNLWKSNPIWLPDRTLGKWTRTHPLAQIDWTTQKNKRCGGHYINVVRCIKYWRQENLETLPKYPKGYPLEHFVGLCCPDGITSLAQGLTLTLENMVNNYMTLAKNNQVPNLPDHGVAEHNVFKRIKPEEFSKFMFAISDTALIARAALSNLDPIESGKLWQKILGSKFKLPENSSPSRVFTQPAAPANPQPTKRFA